MQFLEARYRLSPAWVDPSGALFLLLIPSVLTWAWSQGAPGRDRWTRRQLSVIGGNLVVAAGVLVTLAGPRDLGAVTTRIVVEDEDGAAREREGARPQKADLRGPAIRTDRVRDRRGRGLEPGGDAGLSEEPTRDRSFLPERVARRARGLRPRRFGGRDRPQFRSSGSAARAGLDRTPADATSVGGSRRIAETAAGRSARPPTSGPGHSSNSTAAPRLSMLFGPR